MLVADSELDDPSGFLAAVDAEIEFDTGFNVGGSVGYNFGNNLRAEGEVAYRAADISDITALGISASSVGFIVTGDVEVISFMANAFYDIPTGSDWTPFVGAGLGAAMVSLSLLGADDDDTVLAYQIGAGVSYHLSPAAASSGSIVSSGQATPSSTVSRLKF